jgi:ferredoxin
MDRYLSGHRLAARDYGSAGSTRRIAMSFRVVVDFDRCESNALCMAAAPEVFEVRDDDFLYVLQENPPDDLRAKCEEAARVCPKQAIKIED